MTSYIGELIRFKRNLSIIKNELDKSRDLCLKNRKSCHFLLFKTFSIVHQLNYIFAWAKTSSLKHSNWWGLVVSCSFNGLCLQTHQLLIIVSFI